MMKRIINYPYYFCMVLKLFKSICHGDISYYYCKPDGTVFLPAWTALKIAWVVWMT